MKEVKRIIEFEINTLSQSKQSTFFIKCSVCVETYVTNGVIDDHYMTKESRGFGYSDESAITEALNQLKNTKWDVHHPSQRKSLEKPHLNMPTELRYGIVPKDWADIIMKWHRENAGQFIVPILNEAS